MNNPLNPVLDILSRPMAVVGRVLLGLYFVVPGIFKVTGFAGSLAYMELHGVPTRGATVSASAEAPRRKHPALRIA